MTDFAWVRGFNYQPSYGSCSFEIWRNFNKRLIDFELSVGKKYFPKMNTIRIWLSWDAFLRDKKEFVCNFDYFLGVVSRHNLQVVPVLFNRWHDPVLDNGGIYIDHFLPNASWIYREDLFDDYLEEVVGNFADDERILVWDLCNEPFSYSLPSSRFPEIRDAEKRWLEKIYFKCKELGCKAPLTISTHQLEGLEGLKMVEPISDVLAIHPYFGGDNRSEGDKNESGSKSLDPLSITKERFERLLDDYVDFSKQCGKPLLVTETCWGSLDDFRRGEIIKYTLGELRKRNLGWIVHALWHSLVADLHRPEFGPVGTPGNLSFVEADGSLRRFHEVWNDFA